MARNILHGMIIWKSFWPGNGAAWTPTREQTWEHDREAIRYGWEFEETETGRNMEAENGSSFRYRIGQPSLN